MNKPAPTIRVKVDLANPGQFLACCGLLELADRLWGWAEGWFEGEDFCIASQKPLSVLLAALIQHDAEEVVHLDNGLVVKPLVAPLRIVLDGTSRTSLTLDAWMTVRSEKGQTRATANPPWNFWSGQQTPRGIWAVLREALRTQLEELPPDYERRLFSFLVPLTGRFGFDPGAAWNALDTGFSPNEQKCGVASSPAVELLAAIGLQRFRRPSDFAAEWSTAEVTQRWGTLSSKSNDEYRKI